MPCSVITWGRHVAQYWYWMSAVAGPCAVGAKEAWRVSDCPGPSAPPLPVYENSAACVPETGCSVMGSEVLLPWFVSVTGRVLVVPTCTLPKSTTSGCTTMSTLWPLHVSGTE